MSNSSSHQGRGFSSLQHPPQPTITNSRTNAPTNTLQVLHHRTYETVGDRAANGNLAPSLRTRSGSIHYLDPVTNTVTRHHYHENSLPGMPRGHSRQINW